MKRILASIGLTAVLVLSACTSGQKPYETQQITANLAKQLTKRKAPPVKIADVLTRAQIDQIKDPLIVARHKPTKLEATLAKISSRDGYDTYFSGDRRGLILRNGILATTQGLGFDMASMVMPFDALQKNTRQYSRVFNLLTGEYKAETQTFECTLSAGKKQGIVLFDKSYPVIPLVERCQSSKTNFENRFWISPDRKIVRKSRQWVSPQVGYLWIDQLVP